MVQKKTQKLFLLGIVLTFVFGNSQGQVKEWSLEECIDYAIENNIQIKRQEIQSKISKYSYNQSRANLLPGIFGQLSHNFASGKAVNYEDYSYVNTDQQYGSAYIGYDLDVFNGFSKINTLKQNKMNFLASIQETESLKNQISLNIAAAYLQVLLNKELLEIAEKNLKLAEKQKAKTKAYVDEGELAKADLYEVEAQLANEQLNLTNNQNQLDLSLLRLSQLLDFESAENFDVKAPVKISIEKNLSLHSPKDICQYSLKNLPVIKAAELRYKGFERGLSAARGLLFPGISSSGNFNSRYSDLAVNPIDPSQNYPYWQQMDDNLYKSLRFTLTIPIFNGFTSSTRMKVAKMNVLDSKLNLEQTKLNLREEINTAYANARAAYQRYYSAESAVKNTKEAFDIAKVKYESGMANYIELLIAQSYYSNAESQLASAKYEYLIYTKILDHYRGKKIRLE